MAADISAIVVTFNGREFTPPCLESIPPGVETIVVDNGSTDGTPEEIAARFPSVVLIRNRSNRGFAAAVNQGLRRAGGRFLCLLNNDARPQPGALEALAAHLRENPDVAMVAPQLLHEDGRRQHSFDAFPSLATVFLNKSLLRLLFPRTYPGKRQEVAEPMDVPSVIGACMMVRRSIVDRIGSLDERYFVFLEETDWCRRAWAAGGRVVFVPGAKVVHLQGRTRDRARVRGRIEYVRSLFAFFRKHRPISSAALRIFYPLKSLLEFVFQGLAAPFSSRVRARWVETAALLVWQVAGAPRSMGLSVASDPLYHRLADGSIVSDGIIEEFPALQRRLHSGRVLKDLPGKRTVECGVGERSFIVKTYKPGSRARRLWETLFGRRSARELSVCLEAMRRGVPLVPVAATLRTTAGDSVVVERLKDAAPLQETLLSDTLAASERRKLLLLYGRFCRRIHDAGVWQYDFNPTNVLVRAAELWLIDFERVKVLGGSVAESDRLYLLAKMNRLPRLSRTDRLRFLHGYLEADAPDRERLKRWARAIVALFARQRSEDAAKAGSRCVEENRDFAPFELGSVRGFYRKRRQDRPGPGLEEADVRRIIERTMPADGYRLDGSEDALREWKLAHAQPDGEAEVPVAVLLRAGEARGTLVYPTRQD